VATAQGIADYAEVIIRKDFDVRPVLRDIKTLFLSLVPSDSSLVDLDNHRILLKTVPGARLGIVKSVAHQICLDEWEACQEKYPAFLRELAWFGNVDSAKADRNLARILGEEHVNEAGMMYTCICPC
jgi:pimeloyl-ACP methyl ester carboxylesterase